MDQEQRRIFLLQELLAEDGPYQGAVIPDTEEAQRKLLRAVMNVRPPRAVRQEFLAVQDAYLSEESAQRGIIDSRTLAPTAAGSRLCLWQGDITTLQVDAIVNAANSALLGCFIPLHSCIDNVIHSYSGVQLRLACDALMQVQGHEEPVGRAQITPGYNLPCQYIIHTVGPMITEPLTREDCAQLASCYRSSLALAAEHGVRSIAFCCISTGVFRFPQDIAAAIAIDTVSDFLRHNQCMERVIFNVFTDKDHLLYQQLLSGEGQKDESADI